MKAFGKFGELLLVVIGICVAQTRNVPEEHQVTSSLLQTGVESNEFNCQKNNNEIKERSTTATKGANAVQLPPPPQQAATQSQLSIEDINENDASTVNSSSSRSVVQDWSSVCQQLCGAGLGGAPCASYCQSSVTPSPLTAFAVNKREICNDLCHLQLGDVSCNCTTSDGMPLKSPDQVVGNFVCNSFCEHSHTILLGCSDCQYQTNMRVNVLEVQQDDAAATPDWSKLCEMLCKTGDGGSLCNCNYWPFGF